MRSRRLERGDSRVDSPVVIAALLGVLLGSSASLWVQRSNASHVCAPADCMTCPVCTASTAAAERVAAIPASYPVGGTWRPAEREGQGDAELQAVLKRVAINDEVLVAGVSSVGVVRVKDHSTHCHAGAQCQTTRSSLLMARTACWPRGWRACAALA